MFVVLWRESDSVIDGPVLHHRELFTSLATANTEFEMLNALITICFQS